MFVDRFWRVALVVAITVVASLTSASGPGTLLADPRMSTVTSVAATCSIFSRSRLITVATRQ
jgi:hypothetical protein